MHFLPPTDARRFAVNTHVEFSIPGLVLLLVGAGFLGFGVAYTLWPVRMAALADLELPTRSARTDFTATYGGFQLGIGMFLLACTRHADWLAPGLWAATAALAGFASVRGLGILRSRGRVRSTIWFGLALELIGMVLSAWSLGQVR
jgi:uncharacterized membrane protein